MAKQSLSMIACVLVLSGCVTPPATAPFLSGSTGSSPTPFPTPQPAPSGELTGSQLLALAEDDGLTVQPGYAEFDWSPDSRYVALRDFSHNGDLCRLEIHTREKVCFPRQYLGLTVGTGYVTPRWSPDGKHLAFLNVVSGGSHCPSISLNVIDADLSEKSVTRIEGVVMESHWSPDGTQMAFARQSGGCPESYHHLQLGILDVEKGQTHFLTQPEGQYMLTTMLGLLPWSPDGRELAFIRNDSHFSPYALYTIDADGEHETRIVDDISWFAGWTWDGSGIIYSDGKTIDIIHQPGSSSRLLAEGAFLPIALSPDKRKLLLRGGPQYKELLIVDVDTGQRVDIGPPVDPSYLLPCGRQSWSPDSKRLAFTYNAVSIDSASIVVVNADGSGLVNVADGYCPQWSPDGKYLGYIAVAQAAR